MANLPEADEWVAGIYQIETTDPVVGGAPNAGTGAGMSNIPHQALAKRTTWLKARVDALVAVLVAATTTVAGIVRLNTSTTSTSTTEAATPSAVKAAYDLANARVATSRTVTGAGLATGGGDLAANRVISVLDATQEEAEGGTVQTVAMSPLRVHQAIVAKLVLLYGVTVQAYSAILSSISGLAANGIIARTAAGTVAARTVTASTGLTVTNGDGVAGNPTIAISEATQAEAEAGTISTKVMTPLRVAQAIAGKIGVTVQAASAILSSISGLAANGIITRTAAGTVAARTVTGSTGIIVTNGDGVAGNPTVSLEIASQAEAEAGAIGTKATSPQRVLQALNVLTLGRGQALSSPARTEGVSYQNTGSAPILVMISFLGGSGASFSLSANGTSWVEIARGTGATSTRDNVTFIVPPGYYYRGIDFNPGTWVELK